MTQFEIACNLVNNSVNGSYGSVISEPIGLDVNIENCHNAPPEALPYSCDLTSNLLFSKTNSANSKQAKTFTSDVSYGLVSNTCTGLSISNSGQLVGKIEKTAADTCSVTVVSSNESFSVEKSLLLTVAPSIEFEFSQPSIYLQQGGTSSPVTLLLSQPAPYNTFIEFDIEGDQNEILTGVSYSVRRINILKGDTQVEIDLAVPGAAPIGATLRQKIRLVSGSSSELPSLGLTVYSAINQARNFTRLSAGASNTCGIELGKLYCWGSQSFSILGNANGTVPIGTPTQVGAMSSWSEIALGNSWACGIASGNLYCWGRQSSGQLGNGVNSTVVIDAPVQIGGSNLWTKISAGTHHSCGIRGGELLCWGLHFYGLTGDGIGNVTTTTPAQSGSSTLWTDISVDYHFACGIDDGYVFCWGKGTSGQIGDGLNSNSLFRVQVGSSNGWTKIAVSSDNVCGINGGELFCWGGDTFYAMVGNGDSTGPTNIPVQVGVSDQWTDVELAFLHVCGINSGQLFCWGSSEYSHFKNASAGPDKHLYDAPTLIGLANNWTSVSLGIEHTCGIESGKPFCWGVDTKKQIGMGNSTEPIIFLPHDVAEGHSWTRIINSKTISCCISNNQLHCRGEGTSSLRQHYLVPGVVDGLSKIGAENEWSHLLADFNHSCGIKQGELYCWGSDLKGQLGNGPQLTAGVAGPARIGNSSLWTEVALSLNNTCGINEGALYCWGSDSYGQIGNGSASVLGEDTPLKIGNSSLWSTVTMSDRNVCGIDSGSLYCWGENLSGEVGNGLLTATVDIATKIGSSNLWTATSTGSAHACGIEQGKLYCWGSDTYGQLGNGSSGSAAVATPQQIGSSNQWTSISLGNTHTCGVDGGELYCWGNDSYGQLGNGTASLADVNAPLQIGTSQNWSQASLRSNYSCALQGDKLFCWGDNIKAQIKTSGNRIDYPTLVIE